MNPVKHLDTTSLIALVSNINVSKRKLVLYLYFAVFLAIALHTIFITNLLATPENYHMGTDYLNYGSGAYYAGQGELRQLYTHEAQREFHDMHRNFEEYGTVHSFRTVPTVAIILSPLATFDFYTGMNVLMLINIVLMTSTLILFTKNKKEYLLGIVFMFTSLPFLGAIWLTQISLILASLVGLSLIFYERKKFILAGLFIGLLAIKIQFVVVLPILWVLTSFNKKLLISSLLTALFIFFFGFFFTGLDFIPTYFDFVLNTENSRFGTPPFTTVTLDSISQLISRQDHVKITIVAQAILYPLVLVYLYKKREKLEDNPGKLYLVATILMLIFAVHALAYDLLLLFFPMIYLLFREFDKYKYVFLVLHVVPYLFNEFFGIGFVITLVMFLLYLMLDLDLKKAKI